MESGDEGRPVVDDRAVAVENIEYHNAVRKILFYDFGEVIKTELWGCPKGVRRLSFPHVFGGNLLRSRIGCPTKAFGHDMKTGFLDSPTSTSNY